MLRRGERAVVNLFQREKRKRIREAYFIAAAFFGNGTLQSYAECCRVNLEKWCTANNASHHKMGERHTVNYRAEVFSSSSKYCVQSEATINER
jgi:hypothetical protein